jgi:Zinc-binding
LLLNILFVNTALQTSRLSASPPTNPHNRSKDATAFMCQICRQTFMANSRPPLLYQHVVAKHDGTDPLACFPQHLQGFDPNDPNGEKKAAAPTTPGAATVKPKVVKKKDDPLDLLLDAGLKPKKK